MFTTSTSLLATLALLTTGASASNPFEFPKDPTYSRLARRQSAGNITWSPCFDNDNVECGRLSVPLDWLNESAGSASLAVIRYKATSSPKLGSLFFNPGGPGGSGIDSVAGGLGERVSNITGGFYDVVSWDPRGVNNTLPFVQCFNSSEEEKAFWQGTPPGAGIDARTNFTEQSDVDEYYSQVDMTDQLLGDLGTRCSQQNGDNLKYVGSAANARDLLALTETLDGPNALTNYWGFSYGTLIGSYFVNMFPDRVGRVSIDGVVNPYVWSQQRTINEYADLIQDTDKTFRFFCQACADAGDACVVGGGRDADEIYQWTAQLIDLVWQASHSGYEVKTSDVRGLIFQALYQPTGWTDLASQLAQLSEEVVQFMNKPAGGAKARRAPIHLLSPAKRRAFEEFWIPPSSVTADLPSWDTLKYKKPETTDPRILNDYYLRLMKADELDNPNAGLSYSFQAVTCSDAVDAGTTTTKDVFDEILRVAREVSPLFAPSWTDASMYCHKWPVRAAERYTGPFNKTLNNPILVIGNEADPVTPFASAKAVADGLGDNAILLQQEGYGHLSLAMHSSCTIGIQAQYFIEGILPNNDDTLCATDQPLFSDASVPFVKVESLTPVTESATMSITSSPEGTLASSSQDTKSGSTAFAQYAVSLGAIVSTVVISTMFIMV